MAKKEDILITVSYPFKEFSHEVDEFIRESFELFGINSTGSGTDFNRRDVNGYCTEVDAVNEFYKFIKEYPFPFHVLISFDTNTCGLCGQELDENGFHEDGDCPEYHE